MHRFAIFVDGSNLFGALKSMNLEVQNYEALYGYLYRETQLLWHKATHQSLDCSSELRRTYWYVVGFIDEWDLSLPQSQTTLKNAFSRDKEVRDHWLALAGKEDPNLTKTKLDDKAWALCFNSFREWYQQKKSTLEGMRRFYQGIRIDTNLIDLIDDGHWKVNFLHKSVEEKGLDTSLAVDMVALQDNYDIAIVVSGDADSIPSIRHLKSRNKHIAAVEFISGSPPENKGRTFSSRLKQHADFVVRIYETELIRHKIAHRPSASCS